MIILAVVLTVYAACTAIACAMSSTEDDPVYNGLSYTFIVLFTAFLVVAWQSPVIWGALVVAVWLHWSRSQHPAILSITSGQRQ